MNRRVTYLIKQTNCAYNAGLLIIALSALSAPNAVFAQGKQKGAQPPSNQRNPIPVTFSKSWDYMLEVPVKLIEIGPITDTHRNNLVAMKPGKDGSDLNRTLLLLHWDGQRFVTDGTKESHGQAIDSLFIGKFHTVRNNSQGASPFDRTNGGRPPINASTTSRPSTMLKTNSTMPPVQIVATDGVFVWQNSSISKLFNSPLEVRLALVLGEQESDDRLVCGAGDTATSYEVGDTRASLSTEGAPTTGGGYARFGVGLQIFPGVDKMLLDRDVRYVQSIWEGKYKYMVGLAKGTPSPTPQNPAATTGDRLVVYVPRFASRSKSFWQTQLTDFEEDWRSEPLPGHVLDIRFGDPKSEGKSGILVLTSENKDQEGHLYFYTQDK